MNALVADHSTSRPGGTIIGGSLRRAGFSGVVRYACAGRADVNITPQEVHDLKANQLDIAIVCEHEADWLLHTGSVAGRVQGSRDICRACGLPDGVIYLACDFDVTLGGPTHPGSPGDHNMRQVLSSLEAGAGVIGHGNVGFYGSYFAIQWLKQNAPWIKFYWQTEAWSHGQQDNEAAALFQQAKSLQVAGVSCDINERWHDNFGQRQAQQPPPPPPQQHASGIFNAQLSYDHDARRVTVHGLPGDVKSWGTVKEAIRLELDLQVGQGNPHLGQWTGRVVGAQPSG